MRFDIALDQRVLGLQRFDGRDLLDAPQLVDIEIGDADVAHQACTRSPPALFGPRHAPRGNAKVHAGSANQPELARGQAPRSPARSDTLHGRPALGRRLGRDFARPISPPRLASARSAWAAGNENGSTAKTGQLLGTLDMRAEVVRCWAMTRPSSCTGGCMMRTVVNRRAFDFDEVRFDWGDVVLAAIGWGGWQLLECSAADGLAAACAAEECREQVDTGALRDSVVRLRRARGLLAGEDYERWLADWSLSTEDIRLYFAHTALSGRTAGGVVDQSTDHRPDTAPLARAVRNAAILSGRLQSWAERLAKCAAAAAGLTALGDDDVGPAVARLARFLQVRYLKDEFRPRGVDHGGKG